MVSGTDIPSGRAAVTVPGPHGTDVVVLRDGELVEFGRGGSCRIRFAFAPTIDESVPRVAGRLVVAGQRVFVEVVDEPRRPCVQVEAAGRAPHMVAVGDGFSPREHEFKVVVHGSERRWVLGVRVRPRDVQPVEDGTVPTKAFDVKLSPLDRQVVRAYLGPLRRGRLEPATHAEVAEAIGYHYNTVRAVVYDVWSKLFAAGVPMPDIADKRLAVVEAVRLNRLLDDESG